MKGSSHTHEGIHTHGEGAQTHEGAHTHFHHGQALKQSKGSIIVRVFLQVVTGSRVAHPFTGAIKTSLLHIVAQQMGELHLEKSYPVGN